jgi:hypothetical protein
MTGINVTSSVYLPKYTVRMADDGPSYIFRPRTRDEGCSSEIYFHTLTILYQYLSGIH